MEAKKRLSPFGSRARLWRLTSQAAASQFVTGLLDIVFIDGDHSRSAVLADIQAWLPHVRAGGLLAGHDLFNPAFDGVLEALLIHFNTTARAAVSPGTIHFGVDYVWWIHV
mmetsp:Transcript_19509/g.45764  ORF Transcript_19509/g.45764 Transcript_19509/m.45764 type:complete len:111 (+) Transcript_19509:137-469(+)